MITFSTYDESKLDAQIELVQVVIKDWNWVIWYPNKESLLNSYSREGFTAETRHYAFEDDLLVGFLSSTVENEIEGILWGSIHIPFIRNGYEHIEKELLNKAISVLKSRGVKKIRTIAMPGWGKTIQILEQNGFRNEALLSSTTLYPAKNIYDEKYQKPNHFVEINLPDQKQLLIDAITTISSSPKEAIENYVSNLISNALLLAPVVIKKDTYLGYGFLMKGETYLDIPGRIFLMMASNNELKTDDSIEVIKELFTYFANKALDSNYEILWHEVHNKDILETYEKLGAKFDPCYRYVLDSK